MSRPYKTKTGATQYKAPSYLLDEGDTGWCLACGTEQSGVEPDARLYRCPDCGAHKVYGLEELALMDLVYEE